MVMKGTLEKKLYRKAVKRRSVVLLLLAWLICKIRYIFKPTADKVIETMGSAVIVALSTIPFFTSNLSLNDIYYYSLFFVMGIMGVFLPADVLEGIKGNDSYDDDDYDYDDEDDYDDRRLL